MSDFILKIFPAGKLLRMMPGKKLLTRFVSEVTGDEYKGEWEIL
jgi:hypothetical protein